MIDLLVRDELIAAPRSSLNVPIGATRRIATVHVELQELQKVRSALGGKVNDVVLCAATGALRELLLARGEDPPRQGLRAMVPVNIRREGDHGELGNKVSSLFVELPVAEADPLRRYELVRAAAEKRKAGGQALAASAVTGLTELAPPVLHASLARSLFAKRLFNVTITNVPASPSRLYAFGAPMVDVVPIVPLAAEHALGIAVVSYAGGVTFGLYADRATVPDLDVLRDGIVTSLLELAALAHCDSGGTLGGQTRSAALDTPPELAGTSVDEDRPRRRLHRPADDQSQHPAGIRVEPVAHARAPVAEILELPDSLDRLHVAFLLRPRKTRRPLVADADTRIDPPDLDVGHGIDERRATIRVTLESDHLVKAALPLRCRHHVLDHRPDLLERRVDLDAGAAAQMSHHDPPSCVKRKLRKP